MEILNLVINNIIHYSLLEKFGVVYFVKNSSQTSRFVHILECANFKQRRTEPHNMNNI